MDKQQRIYLGRNSNLRSRCSSDSRS